MGQEIVHCSVCGDRLRSSDFEKGEALRIDHTAYCRKCAPAGSTPDPLPPAALDSTRKMRVGSTVRIPIATPRRPTEAVPASTPPILIWGGAGLAVLILAAAAYVMTSSSNRHAEPPPATALPEPGRKGPRPGTPPTQAPAKAPAPAAKLESAPTTEPAELAASTSWKRRSSLRPQLRKLRSPRASTRLPSPRPRPLRLRRRPRLGKRPLQPRRNRPSSPSPPAR